MRNIIMSTWSLSLQRQNGHFAWEKGIWLSSSLTSS
jgi:hypothetical protein